MSTDRLFQAAQSYRLHNWATYLDRGEIDIARLGLILCLGDGSWVICTHFKRWIMHASCKENTHQIMQSNKKLYDGTVQSNKKLYDGTVPSNKIFIVKLLFDGTLKNG